MMPMACRVADLSFFGGGGYGIEADKGEKRQWLRRPSHRQIR